LSLATGALAAAILSSAAIADRFGRKSLMFASMSLAAALNLAAAAAPSWTALIVLRAASGFALGGVPSVAMTYLAEEMEASGLGFAMGLYVAGTAFGGMVGRMGGGALADAFGWRGAVALVAAIDLVASVGFLILLPPSRRFVRRAALDGAYHFQAWRDHLRNRGMRALFAIGFLIMGSFVTIYNYVEFRLLEPAFGLNEAELGLISLVYVFGIMASSSAGALIVSLGWSRALRAGVSLAFAGVLITLAPNLVVVLAGIVVVTIGFFLTHAVASSWVGRLAGRAKGHAASLYLLSYYVGGSAAGSAGGWFWSYGGWAGVVAFTGAMIALAMVAAQRLARSRDAMVSGRLR
jgi:YNFM family putative membrane transporter